jgi:hypothetical protein
VTLDVTYRAYPQISPLARTDVSNRVSISRKRRELLAGAIALPLLAGGVIGMKRANSPAPRPRAAEGFDFLLGRWAVRHRKLRARLAGSSEWYEFPGRLDVRRVLGGLGNIDENVLEDPQGPYLGTSLRLFDRPSGTWAIYWIDSRFPTIDPPVVGRFDGTVGNFHADDVLDGRPIRVRFRYEDLGAQQARWSQAFSPDAGATWEVNWIMDFTRRSIG